MGSVTVENTGLSGVTVTLSGVSNATTTTDASGQYAFTGLRMGNYSVEISGFDNDEIGFSATASAVAVGVGESKVVSFDGTYLRTAGIQGQVSVEGEGLSGVTVSLTGGPDATDMTTTTDASGQYSFAKLRAGDYAVGISGYNTKDYEFEVTSQNVTVALGETATVPFEGTLLRTAGISGRVFVAGVGHPGVTVTLSGGDLEADMTAETDDAGVYAFSGLAAGDYSVAISGYDDEAYVFDETSKDVTVADDEAAIVNFEGSHATTASISGMLYVDEGTNNDMMDEGETPFAAAGVPVTLVGPGVHDLNTALTNEMGQFMFSELRSGAYQLVVQIPDAVAGLMPDYAYGGPSEGYAIPLAVGQAATQNVPMDITHQTVSFSATLRSGETAGAAIPDATVTLYRDMDGEFKITDGETGDDGMAAIRFARTRGEDGNAATTVYASVATDDYDVADGMETVEFNAQVPMSAAANAGDILNLTADVSFSGATITTDAGGGDALAGWAVSVMMGEGDDAAAVEGDDVPEELDDMGMASFMRTVDAADDLPVTYTFALAEDQDDKLDGGETVETDDPIEYVHDGLSLKGTMDLGTLEARYTTQSIMVYVHHDRDQVKGYTGNILGEDYRDDSMVNISVRHVDKDNGRHMQFAADVWKDTPKKTRHHLGPGIIKFTGVPADANVVVKAAKDTFDIIVLGSNPEYGHNDEIHAYRNLEENGVEGGAFGDQGGFSSTVSLCPLKDTEPTGQFHGQCATFAYVETFKVSGTVTKRAVKMANTGAADQDFVGAGNFDPVVNANTNTADEDPGTPVDGKTVTVTPVDGRNLAGEEMDATTAKKDNSKTKTVNETFEFDFGKLAEGHYAIDVPARWETHVGALRPVADGKEYHHEGAAATLDVKPATGYVYGKLWKKEGEAYFGVEGLTVKVKFTDPATGKADSVSTVTDDHGRYILEGYYATGTASAAGGEGDHKYAKDDPIATVTISKDGDYKPVSKKVRFAKNDPVRLDARVAVPGETATISGTVTDTDDNPLAGVQILVDGEAPANAATSGANKGMVVTKSDGTYTADVDVSGFGEYETKTVKVRAQMPSKTPRTKWRTFVPNDLPAVIGRTINDPDNVDFEGRLNGIVTGQIVRPGGSNQGPMQGVTVTATPSDATYANSDKVVTGTNGTFSLSVSPQLVAYTITATYEVVKDGSDIATNPAEKDADTLRYAFDYPGPNDNQTVSYINEGQRLSFGVTLAKGPKGQIISAKRHLTAGNDNLNTIEFDPSASIDSVTVIWVSGYRTTVSDAGTSALQNVTNTLQYRTSKAGAWVDVPSTTVSYTPAGGAPDVDVPSRDLSLEVDAADDEAKKLTARWMQPSDDSLYFRVKNDVTGFTDFQTFTDDHVAMLRGVDPTPSTPTVKRGVAKAVDHDNDSNTEAIDVDTIGVSFTATGNFNSQFRVAIQVGSSSNWLLPEDRSGTALEVSKTYKGSKITGTMSIVIDALDENGTANVWSIVGGGSIPVTKKQLRGEIKVRVEANQDGVDGTDANDRTWPKARQKEVPVKAKS